MSVESLDASVQLPKPWPEDWEEVAVRLIVTGLVDLADRCSDGEAVRLPYPGSLQRALDRLSVMCLTRGVESPKSVVDLIRWCARPVGTWPLTLAADGLDPDVRFLVGGYPSRDCTEWVVSSTDVEGEFRQNKLIYEVLDICRSNARPDVYVAFRKLLIEKPAMSDQELAAELGRSELFLVNAQLRRAYQPAPPEALLEGVALVCQGCGNLLLPGQSRARACAEPDCAEPAASARAYPAAAGVLWVGRELRVFVCAPGRPELRIWERLRAEGLDVRLWPGFDAADLAVHLAEDEIWYADVKTWANPARLAARLRRRPFIPPYDSRRAFVVIGHEQTIRRRSYVDELRSRVPALGDRNGPVFAVEESDFIAAVLRRERGSRA